MHNNCNKTDNNKKSKVFQWKIKKDQPAIPLQSAHFQLTHIEAQTRFDELLEAKISNNE